MGSDQKTTQSDARRVGEILAVLATGIGKFIFMDWLNLKLQYIVAAIIFWVIYVGLRKRANKDLLRHWGFRMDNFGLAWKMVLPFGIVAVISFVTIGIIQNTINITWHILPILVVYPIWGVIQQFLVIGLVAGNLQDMESVKIHKTVTIVATALLFGAIHYPYNWLIIGTFVLALFYGFVYLRIRNVWVLGLFHGWLGGLFFYTVVDRDPFLEVFGNL